jgi:hypothetical protein
VQFAALCYRVKNEKKCNLPGDVATFVPVRWIVPKGWPMNRQNRWTPLQQKPLKRGRRAVKSNPPIVYSATTKSIPECPAVVYPLKVKGASGRGRNAKNRNPQVAVAQKKRGTCG